MEAELQSTSLEVHMSHSSGPRIQPWLTCETDKLQPYFNSVSIHFEVCLNLSGPSVKEMGPYYLVLGTLGWYYYFLDITSKESHRLLSRFCLADRARRKPERSSRSSQACVNSRYSS